MDNSALVPDDDDISPTTHLGFGMPHYKKAKINTLKV